MNLKFKYSTVLAKASLMLMAVTLLPPTLISQTNSFCDTNHTKAQFTYSSRECTDPTSGLLVNYVLTDGFQLTYTNGLVLAFDAFTVNNSSTGYGPNGGVLCGPDTQPTATGTATNGSGSYVYVTNYSHATYYDINNILIWPIGQVGAC